MEKLKVHRIDWAPDAKGPLDGIRVVDLSRLVCGNLLTVSLADMGAEVIKIEPLGKGDTLRAWGDGGVQSNWKVYGRNKKSLALDLRRPDSIEIVRKLAATAQIFVEGFRPGRLEEMGLGPDVLHGLNPKLVIVRISGYGQTGPYKDRPGFGSVIESLSGFASRNGFPDREPVLPPFALADSVAALQGAFAAMVALREAERDGGPDGPGRGQVVDLPLLEPLYSILGPEALAYKLTGRVRRRCGSASHTASPRNVYETRDGKFVGMSASIQTMAERVFRMIGREDMIADPRYDSNRTRMQHREEVDAAVGGWIKTKTLAEVLEIFERSSITASAVYEQPDILNDPHFIEREVVVELPDDDVEGLPMHNIPVRLSRTPGAIRTPAPAIGEHSAALLEDLGYTAEQIEQLKEKGVVEG
ncbi:MAG: CoA transferase [Rhodospirillales bacterium CG15_BIG_FIL_POST_REV_8_21_14_020_66_15]|nr:MAG: CoA transferase [Rhodospirillales bacterium CG15_BIG_FIL_POST_REV_8_21_14_020_66_15]